MSRYIDEMSREELVREVIDLLKRGVFEPHEVGDPTILTTRALREGLRRVRLCILREGRVGDGEGASRAPSITPIPAGSDSPEA
jgi:hypothetical protein